MSISKKLENDLRQELETRIKPKTTDGAEVSGSFVTVILPIIISVLQQLLSGCNQTPETAAKRLKEMGPWTKANLRRGIRRESELRDVREESLESVVAVVDKNDEATFEQMIEEEREERVDWSLV